MLNERAFSQLASVTSKQLALHWPRLYRGQGSGELVRVPNEVRVLRL
jgi:hypothetical protein